MKKCAFCGCDNSDDSKFCVNCGTSLPEAAATPLEPVEPVAAAPVQPKPEPQPRPEYRSAIDPQPTPAPAPDYGSYNYNANQATNTTTYSPKAAPQKTNGLCIAGFVISLVSILCFGFSSIISLILSIVGYVGASKKNQKGKGFAVAGIVISIVMIVFFAFVMMLYFLGDYMEDYSGSSSSRIEEEEDGEIDYSDMNISRLIKNEDWVEVDSDSFLVFDNSRTFHYYREYDNQDGDYYTGTYEIYVGEDAMEYITEDLEEYGVTEEEINDFIDRNEEYTLDNLICIVLYNESCIVDGEETFDHTVMTPYFGYYLVEGDAVGLDIANMNAAEYYMFVPEDQYLENK